MDWGRSMVLLSGLILLPSWGAAVLPASLKEPLDAVRAVGPEGRGNEAAGAAVLVLSAANADAIPALLESMDGANDYALNWLRSAVEAIVQREGAAGHPLPLDALETLLRDRSHEPRARRMAYELIRREDPARAARLLPEFQNDPGAELRRDAVSELARAAALKASGGDRAGAVEAYRRALGFAREADQIDGLAKSITDLGETVDLREAFGWVTRWKVIGPFDNTGGAGFGQGFPPETGIEASGEFEGKKGRVQWQDFETKDDHGLVDFNGPLSPLKEVTAYAWTEVWSDRARPVQIRLGCKNGWKVWLNGRFIFGRDEYHRNMEMDQYRLPVELKAGRNTLLVKCCQNEQTEDWTKEWEFQLRITDPEGTPVRSSR
ncbi:MAG: HEAT repeat domain-containing protein [Verrucomicrobiales bacterium]|nr:HEAT repeat domain-containing protein [Verrucomicrobiales bacterium]